jgi:hypothetical protein
MVDAEREVMHVAGAIDFGHEGGRRRCGVMDRHRGRLGILDERKIGREWNKPWRWRGRETGEGFAGIAAEVMVRDRIGGAGHGMFLLRS